MIKSELVEYNFSRHPADYNQIAETQKTVAKQLAEFIKTELPCAASPVNILELGCGTGFLTKHLVKIATETGLTVTDISPAMLNFCRENLPYGKNVKFALCDITKGCLDEKFDIITSSLAFQWVEDQKRLMEDLHEHLTSNGKLLFTTLTKETFANIADLFEKHNHPFPMPPLMTVEELKKAAECFKEVTIHEDTFTETYSSVKDFLKHIHKVGAGNATGTHIPVAKLREIIRNKNAEKAVTVEYKVAFAVCKKQDR